MMPTGPSDYGGPGPADASTDTVMPPAVGCPPPRVAVAGPDGTPTETCTSALASSRFQYGICSCDDLSFGGALTTRAFDSGAGGGVDSGAPVGVNGELFVVGGAHIGGTFVSSGTSFLSTGSGGVDLTVRGDAMVGGGLGVINLSVARDARIDGDLFVAETMSIGRDLYRTPGRTTTVGTQQVTGAVREEAVRVPPPCPCDAASILDVASLVTQAAAQNDNAVAGVDPAAWADATAVPATLVLRCGRYYVNALRSAQGLSIRVEGRSALFVGDGIRALAGLRIDLAPGAELDLFVKGDVTVLGDVALGDASRPAALRMYMAGAGGIFNSAFELFGGSMIAGNLYAPRTEVRFLGVVEIRGALFAAKITHVGALELFYDRAILDANTSCDAPVSACDPAFPACPQGHACVAGTCAPCRSDADCKQPLVCHPDGSCGQLLI
jgi:hypothetical protein